MLWVASSESSILLLAINFKRDSLFHLLRNDNTPGSSLSEDESHWCWLIRWHVIRVTTTYRKLVLVPKPRTRKEEEVFFGGSRGVPSIFHPFDHFLASFSSQIFRRWMLSNLLLLIFLCTHSYEEMYLYIYIISMTTISTVGEAPSRFDAYDWIWTLRIGDIIQLSIMALKKVPFLHSHQKANDNVKYSGIPIPSSRDDADTTIRLLK